MRKLINLALLGASFIALQGLAYAQDATWLANPGSSNWNTGTNWSTGTVPTGAATFGASSNTTVTLSSATTTIDGMTFNSGAPSYTFYSAVLNSKLIITGAGIINNSASVENFPGVNGLEFHNASTAGNAAITPQFYTATNGVLGYLTFNDTSNAGTATIVNQQGSPGNMSDAGPATNFFNSSSAANATIINQSLGDTNFYNTSTAGNATITNKSSCFGGICHGTNFYDNSSAGNAVITGHTLFTNNSTAGNATLSGPNILFQGNATAGNATIIIDSSWNNLNSLGGLNAQSTARLVLNNATLDQEYSSSANMEIGSIEGSGYIRLPGGAVALLVGKNNLSTTFNGGICASPICGLGNVILAVFTKTGTGSFTLNGTLEAGTTVSSGGFVVGDASHANSAISGDVQIGSAGQLSGTGTITGALKNDQGGTVAPGASVGTLTAGSYVQGSNSTLTIDIDNTGASALTIVGNASLNGSLVLDFASGYQITQPQQDYTILSANVLSGQFSSVTSNIPSGYTYAINYLPTSVRLSVLSGGANIDANFAAVTTPYSAPPNATLLGVSNILSPRPITLNGQLTLNTVQYTIEMSGIISGTGPMIISGAGTAIFSAANAYTGGTTINNGATLQIGNGGATGSIVGDVTDNGMLTFDHSDAFTFSGVIGGSGGVSQIGSGTLTLSGTNTFSGGLTVTAGTLILNGANTYTGGTTITGGTLQIGNGGTAGSITGNVVDNGTLVFDHSDTFTFAGGILGTGGLIQLGSGMLVLNNQYSYSGPTTISAGTLMIGDASHPGASIAGNVTVSSGGTLKGYGAISGSVNNAGIVAPGGSIGTLRVGSFTQSAAGTLQIEVSPTASDLVIVNGTAALGGTLDVSFAAGQYGTRLYTTLVASNISGAFATVRWHDPTGDLVLGTLTSPTNLNVIVEPKQKAALYSDFTYQSFTTAEHLNDAIFTHMANQHCRTPGTTARDGEPDCPALSVWANTFGNVGEAHGHDGASFFSTRSASLIGGYEYHSRHQYWIGLAGAYGRSNLNLASSGGAVSADSYAVSLNGGIPLFNGRLAANLMYLQSSGNSRRVVTPDGGSAQTARAHPRNEMFAGALQYSHALLLDDIEAYGRLNYAHLSHSAYAESGASPFDFAINANDPSSFYGDIGLRFSQIFEVEDGALLVPDANVGLRTVIGPLSQDDTVHLADADGMSLVAPGADRKRFSLVAGFGVSTQRDGDHALFIRADGRSNGSEKEGTLSIGAWFRF